MSPGREDVESLGERCLREVLVGFVVIVVVVEDILIANKASFYVVSIHKISLFVQVMYSPTRIMIHIILFCIRYIVLMEYIEIDLYCYFYAGYKIKSRNKMQQDALS